ALTLVPGAPADEGRGRKYALLVGVKSYEHSKLPDLRYTENDVEDLARLLRQTKAGFRGVAYSWQSNFDRAIADYSEAIRLRPLFAKAYQNRGHAYKARGNKALADADYATYRRLSKER